jgi:2-keto-4-pentenoate hydratase/2-oxohepta-3-ene-1,7-dioic acid hydratase in catechol pathway
MRLVTFHSQDDLRVGAVSGDRVVDLAGAAEPKEAPWFVTMEALLNAGEPAMRAAKRLAEQAAEKQPLSSLRLGPPVPRPTKILALGFNYHEHAAEFSTKAPEAPLIFAKYPNSICGPFDPIVLPPGDDDPQVDYEAELAVVIGRRCKGVAAARAMDVIAGYMSLNDVSERKWQFGDKQWTRGKSPDSFCPIGPWLITPDEVPDPHALGIRSRVNGEIRQDSSTSLLVHRVPRLIEYCSTAMTLEPGDIIATGTPTGVGMHRKPPLWLKPGDVVEIEIDGVGTIRNEVQAPGA